MTETELHAILERVERATRGKSWAFQTAGRWRFRIPPVFDRHQRAFIGHAPDDIRALAAALRGESGPHLISAETVEPKGKRRATHSAD